MSTRPIVSESLTGSHVSVAKYVQFMLTCLRRNMLNIVLCEPQVQEYERGCFVDAPLFDGVISHPTTPR
jgi:hypothetical protein